MVDTRHDAELVIEVASGNEAALEALFHRHGDSVLTLARHMLQNREEAEEVVQDTFMRLYRHADAYRPERAALRTWLYAIARNLCLSRLRARGSRPVAVTTLDPHAPDFAVSAGASFDPLPGILVRSGLDALDPEERTLLQGSFFQGYSHVELAAQHGLPLGTVKSKLRRALLKLRDLLGQDAS